MLEMKTTGTRITSITSGGKGGNGCAADKAAYLGRTQSVRADGTRTRDYSRRAKELVGHTVLSPAEETPDWIADPATFAAAADWQQQHGKNVTQIADEVVLALPHELKREDAIAACREFVKREIVDEFGTPAHIWFHDGENGSDNLHAHILFVPRTFDQAEWGDPHSAKLYEKAYAQKYVCRRNGAERLMTAAEFKAAKAAGWEKVYCYATSEVPGGKSVLSQSEAKARGLTNADRTTRAAIQRGDYVLKCNRPDHSWAKDFRQSWTAHVNAALEQRGAAVRYDHRKYAERAYRAGQFGMNADEAALLTDIETAKIAGVHLGETAAKLERQGIATERGNINRAAAAHNAEVAKMANDMAVLLELRNKGREALGDALDGQLHHLGIAGVEATAGPVGGIEAAERFEGARARQAGGRAESIEAAERFEGGRAGQIGDRAGGAGRRFEGLREQAAGVRNRAMRRLECRAGQLQKEITIARADVKSAWQQAHNGLFSRYAKEPYWASVTPPAAREWLPELRAAEARQAVRLPEEKRLDGIQQRIESLDSRSQSQTQGRTISAREQYADRGQSRAEQRGQGRISDAPSGARLSLAERAAGAREVSDMAAKNRPNRREKGGIDR